MIYLLKHKYAKIIFSIIWGLGLSTLFQKICHDRNCIIYTAPDPIKLTDNVYQFDKSCYKFTTQLSKCDGPTVNSY